MSKYSVQYPGLFYRIKSLEWGGGNKEKISENSGLKPNIATIKNEAVVVEIKIVKNLQRVAPVSEHSELNQETIFRIKTLGWRRVNKVIKCANLKKAIIKTGD